ncbi:hypothetical protein QN379_20280 [Glaciimonas sp. Gout2]|uniref:hypothetical protein n=1 Tax=unclassified Glaciimonas TaxID=2644401 RepID=UPI002B23180F|nr:MULTISPECIES: hypothetical protein [unclassified Glaciimonas]MEB0014392.1 hypothetical protein [Glaciimonas sp. Cout2]MEB0084350.1 hypothetical protein [Glaciimonas sp. Gout2]
MPKGVANMASRLPELLETTGLPSSFRELLQPWYAHLKELDKQLRNLALQWVD